MKRAAVVAAVREAAAEARRRQPVMRRRVTALVIRGETLIQRLLREARTAASQRYLHHPRARAALAHRELHARLKAAGVEVES